MRRPAFYSLVLVFGLFIAFMAMPVHPIQAAGATYYVDDGNCPGPGTGTKGDSFCKIQDGIDAASSGDTVQVFPGTYIENITMKSGVVIQGAGAGDNPSIHSIIDGGGTGSVVSASGVDSAAKLDGFKVTNGDANDGGGMYNYQSSPTLTNCTFSENLATGLTAHGGGMYNWSSSPALTNCTFSGNSADYFGGGMYNWCSSSPTLTNCTFSGNSADYFGGGIYNLQSSPTLTNCTFSGNSADYFGGGMYNLQSSPTLTNCTFSENLVTGLTAHGGGMYNSDSSSPTLTNCILWGDTPEEFYNQLSSPVVTYSDIQGGYPGTGNINSDPLFVDPDGPDNIPGNQDDDFHLKPNSPCIDSGDNSAPDLPATDFDGGDRRIDDPTVPDTGNGTAPIVDIGVDEFQPKGMFYVIPIKKKGGGAVIYLE